MSGRKRRIFRFVWRSEHACAAAPARGGLPPAFPRGFDGDSGQQGLRNELRDEFEAELGSARASIETALSQAGPLHVAAAGVGFDLFSFVGSRFGRPGPASAAGPSLAASSRMRKPRLSNRHRRAHILCASLQSRRRL